MKNKTEFYRDVHQYAKSMYDPIAFQLWEVRRLVVRSGDAGPDLLNQINGALRVRFKELKNKRGGITP